MRGRFLARGESDCHPQIIQQSPDFPALIEILAVFDVIGIGLGECFQRPGLEMRPVEHGDVLMIALPVPNLISRPICRASSSSEHSRTMTPSPRRLSW